MSRVRFLELELAGFRSFSPDKPGVFAFQPSLSVIVGDNGTGKSTLVEVLRYVMTGHKPAGNSDALGHPFINDQEKGGARVNAHAHVEFVDVKGCRVRVSRALNLTKKMKGKKMNLKSESPVIYRLKDDVWTEIANKIRDTNAEVSNMLGVSSAILKYVIFCTQEDSYWPMSDPKSLKDKFEDIFESKRYIIFNALHKLRREKEDEAKKIEENLYHFRNYVDQASEKKHNLEEMIKQRAEILSDSAARELKVTPLRNKLATINESLKDLQNLEKREDQLKTKLEGSCKRQHELEKDVRKDVSNQSEEDLKLSWERLADDTQTQKVNDLVMSLDETKLSIETKEASLDELHSVIGRLAAEEDIFAKNEATRDTLMITVANQLHIEGFERNKAPFDDAAVGRLGERLGLQLQAAKTDAAAARAKGECELETLTTDKDALNAELSRLHTTSELKAAEEKGSVSKANDIRARINLAGIPSRQMEVEATIERLDWSIAATRANCDEMLQGNILGEMREKKADIDARQKMLVQKLMIAKELAYQEDELSAKQNEKSEMPTGRLAELIHVEPANDYFSIELDATRSGLEMERREAEAAFTRTQTLLGVEAERAATLRASLAAAESGLREKRTAVSAVTESPDVKLELARQAAELEQLNGKRGRLVGQTELYKASLDQLNQQLVCSVCGRICDASQKAAMVATLAENMRNSSMEETLRAIEKAQLRNEALERVRPVDEAATVLASTTIPALRKDLDEANTRHSQLTRQLHKENESVKEITERDEELRSLGEQFHSWGWDRLSEDMRRLSSAIEDKRRIFGSTEDVHELQVSLKHLTDERAALDTAFTSGQRRLYENIETLHRLQEERIAAQKEQFRLNQDSQDKERLTANLDDMVAEAQAAAVAAAEARAAAALLPGRIDNRQTDIAKRREALDTEARAKASTVRSIEDTISSLERVSAQLGAYKGSGHADSLARERAKRRALRQSIASGKEELGGLTKQRSVAENVVRHRASFRRELSDAMDSHRLGKEILEMSDELADVRRRLGSQADRGREKNRLQSDIVAHVTQLHINDGRIAEIDKSIEQLEVELLRPEYSDAVENLRSNMQSMVLKEGVAGDLGKYAMVTERGVFEFHKSKMAEMNEILERFWVETYRGTDISALRVATEDESGASMKVTAGGRRNYSYSVQMRKGDGSGQWVEMRQRCSAGQRVLASILIRVALAEVFSDSCGFLALDEPTTNLDEENAENLAYSLAQLVSRKNAHAAHHFQMLLITHERKFVENLVHMHPELNIVPDHYVRVEKDEKGHSRLKKVAELYDEPREIENAAMQNESDVECIDID